jgi:hypothetical protein
MFSGKEDRNCSYKKNQASIYHTFRAACIHTSSGVEDDPTGRPRVKLIDHIVGANAMEKRRVGKQINIKLDWKGGEIDKTGTFSDLKLRETKRSK